MRSEISTPLAINPDLHRTLETSFESSMATWWLVWHMTVMINYLYNHCQADPVLKAVCNHLHGAIRESCQISAQAALVAIAAHPCMILHASPFRDCWPLSATLLSIPFVGSSHSDGQFQSSVKEATHSQEKLSEVRWLASAGSRAAQELPVPEPPSSLRNLGLLPLLLPLQPPSHSFRGWRLSCHKVPV